MLFEALRQESHAALVCEPRHESWFTPDVEQWFAERHISRAGADPARALNADQPGGWQGLRYFRLHGSPRVYYSAYDDKFVSKLGEQMSTLISSSEVWCIFDNTTLGAAMENALSLQASVAPPA